MTRRVDLLTIRKKLYCCEVCDYLFSNELKGDREEYFVTTTQKDNLSGHRGQREADLVSLANKLLGFSKESQILIYAVGKNRTVEILKQLGYTNVWSSDIVDNDKGDSKFVNIGRYPNYFKDKNINFDIITAVEVWEHYGRKEVNPCFKWIYDQVSAEGIVLATPSVWRPKKIDDSYYNARHEWGDGQLSWWHYPYFLDHGAFYSQENLSVLAERNGFRAVFGYCEFFGGDNVDPFKRIMIGLRKGSELDINGVLEKEFCRKFHPITY